MEYDCSRTLDYSHELKRMCHGFKYCEDGCPLEPLHACDNTKITQQHIDIVQKWSDEHPEKPKLTKEEYDFLASFVYPEELFIRKGSFTMQLDTSYAVGYSNATIQLREDMFPFIKEGDLWTAENLLHLEVKE